MNPVLGRKMLAYWDNLVSFHEDLQKEALAGPLHKRGFVFTASELESGISEKVSLLFELLSTPDFVKVETTSGEEVRLLNEEVVAIYQITNQGESPKLLKQCILK